MLKVKVVALGKYKEAAYKELEAEFLKRLKPFAKIAITELPEVPYRDGQDLGAVKLHEAENIRRQVSEGSILILLEERGKTYDSPAFAQFLKREGESGRELIFVLGSGIGLHPSLRDSSDYVLSLSPLTFPHNLARVVLLEQLYRAGTILAGKDYHK